MHLVNDFVNGPEKTSFYFVSEIWLGPHQHADMVNCAMLKDVPITLLILNIQFYGIATSLKSVCRNFNNSALVIFSLI